MDESKLIFYTGAPGSKWSAVAHLITFNNKYPINISDYSAERTYTHLDRKVSHLGAYWGPGNGIGERFHELASLSKDEILDEINKPYTDKNWEQYRLVKCHHFSIQLDYIAENFPKSKIIIVLRPDDVCIKGWLSAGGFDKITYPDYHTYYKNPKNMEEIIKKENSHSIDFINRYNLSKYLVTESYLKDFWNINCDTNEKQIYINSMVERKKFMKSLIERKEIYGSKMPIVQPDVSISHYNFKEP